MRTFKILKQRLSRKDVDFNANLDRNRVKTEIDNYCIEYLKDSGDILKFEVNIRDLDHVVAIIESNELSKYEIFQIDKTIFGVQLKEIELF